MTPSQVRFQRIRRNIRLQQIMNLHNFIGEHIIILCCAFFNTQEIRLDEDSAQIIDWMMLDLNGIETVRRIRKLIGESKPIIILTAYDWADIGQEAREAGVTAFFLQAAGHVRAARRALAALPREKGGDARVAVPL